ncbi:hypothetical protein DL96DRAFT_1589905 [Flagelloscypha sp. PMI_526]|nr:hypothetical protein DL96DRAFT_1589905 [Flagelloscypha sp. PMI_526]
MSLGPSSIHLAARQSFFDNFASAFSALAANAQAKPVDKSSDLSAGRFDPSRFSDWFKRSAAASGALSNTQTQHADGIFRAKVAGRLDPGKIYSKFPGREDHTTSESTDMVTTLNKAIQLQRRLAVDSISTELKRAIGVPNSVELEKLRRSWEWSMSRELD